MHQSLHSEAEGEGVLHRAPDGSRFQLDQNRVAYLRRERRQSPRSEAAADHVKVKTEMLQPRLMEKKRELVRQEDVDELRDMLEGRGVAPRNDDSQRHGPARGGIRGSRAGPCRCHRARRRPAFPNWGL